MAPPVRLGGSASFLTTTFGARSTPSAAAADFADRLLLRLHDPGKRCEPRLVEPEVDRDHGRQDEIEGLHPAVHLPQNGEPVAVGGEGKAWDLLLLRLTLEPLRLRGEGGLRQAEARGEILADLVLVVIDGLLAEKHQVWLLLRHDLP
jgi:hypothetical protein